MHRSAEDDAAVVVHQRSGRIDGKESTVEVCADYLLEDGFVGRASRRPARNACIGKDDVEFAEVFGEFSEKLLAVLCNRNVGAIAVRFRSQLGDRFIQCLLIATCNCDFRAFRDEKAGCGQADAAVASGNESLLACELRDSSSMTDPLLE